MRAFKHPKPFLPGYAGRDGRKILAHKPCVVTDDQGLSRRIILSFQITADRIGDTFNIRERKVVGDYCSPAGRSKSNIHPATFSHEPPSSATANLT